MIDQATSDQKKLQSSIGVYQSHMAMSPAIEEQWKLLTRDNDNAQRSYQELLAKRSSADLATKMENQQEGEQMKVMAAAGLPDSPSFPTRPLFAAGGLGVGFGLGLLIAVWLEFSDTSIRTAKDAAAVMDLPLLISVPWLGEEEVVRTNGNGHGNGNGSADSRRRFWGRPESPPSRDRDGEKVEV